MSFPQHCYLFLIFLVSEGKREGTKKACDSSRKLSAFKKISRTRIKMMRLDATRISTNRALLVSLSRSGINDFNFLWAHTCIINIRIVSPRNRSRSNSRSEKATDSHFHDRWRWHLRISRMEYSEHASFSMNWDVKVVNTKLDSLLKRLNYKRLVLHLPPLYAPPDSPSGYRRFIPLSHRIIPDKTAFPPPVHGMT